MPRRRFDVAPWAVIALCVAWTGQTLWFGKTLVDAGAITRYWLWRGDLWRIPATIFLHGGLTHLIVNCLGILFIGPFVSRTFGGLLFCGVVSFSALAGLGASLITHDPNVMLVGISGGVVGMLGVILGVEWRMSTGFSDFLRQRNTIVVLVVLVLNAILAVFIESNWDNVRIDHAAHIGGFVFGLIATLALLGKRSPDGTLHKRNLGAMVVTLLLSVVPLVYAAVPQWSVQQLRILARQAVERGDRDRARQLYGQVLDLDPQNPIAGAWVALIDNDLTRLDSLREPVGDHERKPVLMAYLNFAIDRVQEKPDEALAILKRVSIRGKAFGAMWLSFAETAEQAGATAPAAYAYNEAAISFASVPSMAWRAARGALPVQLARISEQDLSPEERVLRAMEAAGIVLNAVGGVEHLKDQPGRADDIRGFAAALFRVAEQLSALERPPEGWRELFGKVKQIFLRLADNWIDGPHEAGSLFYSARAWWLEIKADDVDPEELRAVAARYRQALIVARERGETRLELHIQAWFLRRGLPEPILADEEGDD